MDAVTWDQVKDLFADALELKPEDRDAFLASHCSNPAVIAEILDLLKNFDEEPDFLSQPVVEAKNDTLGPGSHVGPYVILRRLGGGGMGQVFLSNDDRLERKVALKRLIPSRVDPAVEKAKILTEARAAARINHPNVAAVHDVLEHDGRIFIVMEFVDGESLAVCLRREWLPLDRVLTIGRQLAAALVAAHAQGVVHRDLKPANVQLTANGSVKVLDFGIAAASTPLAKLTTRTKTVVLPVLESRGGAAGTPEYMSPEQVQGRPIDQRSDIFSLGLILYEMVTGRRPFADMGLLDRRATATDPVVRADIVDPRVPKAVADLIAKALETDVHSRFQTARDVESGLEQLQQGPSPVAPAVDEDFVAIKLKRWVIRAAQAAAAAVVTFLVCGAMSAAAFNLTLTRPARFAPESISSYIEFGFRANGVLIATTVLIALVAFGVQFLVRLACLLAPIRRLRVRIGAAIGGGVSALGLTDPQLLARGLAAVGLIALVATWWLFGDLINAMSMRVSLTPPELLRPLAPDNVRTFMLYRLFVDLLLLSLGTGLVRIVGLRARTRTRQGAGAIVLASGVFGLVALLHILPYRVLYQNEFERVEVDGARCYLLGQASNDSLIYCPDVAPPRNRVIASDAPNLHRSGISESVFTQIDRGSAGGAAAPQTR